MTIRLDMCFTFIIIQATLFYDISLFEEPFVLVCYVIRMLKRAHVRSLLRQSKLNLLICLSSPTTFRPISEGHRSSVDYFTPALVTTSKIVCTRPTITTTKMASKLPATIFVIAISLSQHRSRGISDTAGKVQWRDNTKQDELFTSYYPHQRQTYKLRQVSRLMNKT